MLSSFRRSSLPKAFLAAAALGLAAAPASAATLYWDGGTANIAGNGDGASAGGNGTWNTTLTNWDAGTGAHVAWNNAGSDTAVFAGTAGTVTLGTGITAGGLTFNTAGYTVTGNTLTLGGTTATVTVTNAADSATVASSLAGSAGLAKAGAGTLVLSGTNSYAGATAVNAGILSVGGSGVLGSGNYAGNITVASGATFEFASAAAQTLTGKINGGGTLSVAAGSTLIWNGAHDSGNLTIAGAGVLVKSSGSTNWGAGGSTTFAMTGGEIRVEGSGTVLSVGSSGNEVWTNNKSSLYVGEGATFDAVEATAAAAGGVFVDALNGSGTVKVGYSGGYSSTITFGVNNGSGTFSGVLANSNAAGNFAKAGTGTQILSGQNTYTGTTTISGGVLQIGAGGTSGTLGSGSVTNNASLVFNRSDNFTVSNAISGTGTLTQAGSGATTLTGGSSYAGATVVNAGKLVVNGTLRGTSGITVNAGATLETGGTNIFVGGHGTALSDTFAINVNGGTWTITGGESRIGNVNLSNGATWTSNRGVGSWDWLLANTASGAAATVTVSGAGKSVMNGTGGIHLQGVQNFNVADTVAGADLEVSMILANPGSAGGAAGGVNKLGAGTMVLTGANTYQGGTIISEGVLQVGNGGTSGTLGSGAVTNNASLVFDRSDTVTVSNVISGTGSLTKNGAGTLVLTAENDYAGGTVVNAGTLQLSDANNNGTGTVRGVVTVNAGGTLLATVANVFGFNSGARVGTLNINGGTVTSSVNGDNGWGLTVNMTGGLMSSTNNGYFSMGGGSAINTLASSDTATISANLRIRDGNVNNRLTFTVADGAAAQDLVVSGILSQQGGNGIAKEGAGTMVLTGANNYNGPTLVNGGTLQIGGGGNTGLISAASAVTVASGAALSFNYGVDATLNFANAISGAGEIRQDGAGIGLLSGNNAGFTGKTTVTAGTLKLQTATARASTFAGALDIAGGTFDSNNFNVTTTSLTGAGTLAMGSGSFTMATGGSSAFAGVVSGTGALTVDAASSLTLSGANTYTGVTTINGDGVLTLGAGGASGSIASASVTLNQYGTLLFNRSDAVTASYAISGGGAVRSISSGSVTLNGALDNVDALNHGSGTFVVSNAGSLLDVGNVASPPDGATASTTNTTITATGTVDRVVCDNGTLNLTALNVATLVQVSGGVAAISADISNTADVIVDGGTLRIGSGASDTVAKLSSANVSVDSPGTLVLNAASLTIAANALDGTGTVETLAGTAAATGSLASFTGTLRFTGGTFTASDLGGVTALDFNKGTFDAAITGAASFSGVVIAQDGTASYFNSNQDITLTGALTGSGIIQNLGTGKLIVSGADISNFHGRIIDAYSPFDMLGNDYAFSRFGDITPGQGKDYYNTSSTYATLTADISTNAEASGVIGGTTDPTIPNPGAGNMNFVKSGTGTLFLSGNNVYNGTTTVNGGVLQIGTGGTSGTLGTGAVTINSAGTLTFNRSDDITVANDFSGAGALTQDGSGAATFTGAVTVGRFSLNASGSATFSGAVNVSAFSQTGGGAVTFSGDAHLDKLSRSANAGLLTFGANATVGELEQNGTGGSGIVLGGGTFTVSSGRYDGEISGSGVLEKAGTGTLILGGDCSLDAQVRIQSGKLQLGAGGTTGSLTASGDILDNGTFAISRSDTVVMSSRITGVGAFEQAGTGTVVLTAENTYLGATRILAGGTLRIGDYSASVAGSGLSGGISALSSVENNGVLVLARAGDLTFTNAISGSGSLVQAGSGTLTLGGSSHTYTGDTGVVSGTLVVNTGALPGGSFSSSGAGVLRFTGTGPATVAKDISGSGTVEFTGTGGVTTLAAGTYSHTGALSVSGGHTLNLGVDSADPALLAGSRATVGLRSALTGSGSLASLTNYGVVAPGHSPGVITLSGDFVQGGSGTLNMEVAGTGAAGASNGYDQVLFGGQARLGGALVVSFINGYVPRPGDSAVLLKDTNTADGQPSFVGAFDSVTVSGGRLVFSDTTLAFMAGSSIAQSADLSLHDGVRPFVDALSPEGTTLVHPALADFIAITDPGARSVALQKSSPVGLAALTALPIGQVVRESDELRRRAEAQARAPRSVYGEASDWLAYVGGNGGILNHDEGEASAPTFDSRSFGGFGGLERRLGDGSFALGLRLGYDRGMADLHQGGGDISQDHARATLYGTALVGDAGYVSGGVGMGYSSYETKRNTLRGEETASPSGWDISAFVSGGYVMHINPEWTFTPHAGLSVVSASVGGFTETGSDLALAVDGYTHTSVRSRLGATLMREWRSAGYSRDSVRFGLDAAYERTLAGDKADLTSGFASLPAFGNFTTSAPALTKDTFVLGPQAEWVIDENSGVSAGYRFVLGADGTTGHRFDLSYERRF